MRYIDAASRIIDTGVRIGVMMNAEAEPSSAPEGSAAALIEFLNWTISKNELVEATATSLRTGCTKVLSVEEDWARLDLRTADLDNIVGRFKNRHRLDMKDQTRDAYERRFRQSVDMYLRWLAGDPTWKPSQRRRSSSGKAAADKPSPALDQLAASVPSPVQDVPSRPQGGMITYPFPIRPGVRGAIELPEDLTPREAQRIAAFVATLAVEAELEVESPRAIGAGQTDASTTDKVN